MARSPGMSQALARSPGLVVSTVLTCMVGALLPPLPGLTLFVGGLGLAAVLCAGGLEQPAVRLLDRARVLSEAEAAALAPAIALLCQKSLGPPTVKLYVRDGEGGIRTGAAGGHSVVVSAGRSDRWLDRRSRRTDSPGPDQVRRRSRVLDDSVAA